MHVVCLGVLLVGWSPFAVGLAIFLYVARMFAITGFYHRYFSHRSFKSSRVFQFIMAVWGGTSVQRGALWWAAHHRHHHRHSDEETDVHSPTRHGFWWSHMVWFTSTKHFTTAYNKIKDFARYPELRFLNRYDLLVPILFALAIYIGGELLAVHAPGLGTDGPQLLIWGFFVSTVVLFHATFTINSLAHVYGKRRYNTKDGSRNNWLLALITLGEGWHNNHHRYPGSVRQGFFWWEIDLTWYGLKLLSLFGLVWDLRPVPARIRREGKYSGRT
ncbi:MAG: acyl-CoA desaturase [Acidobacteriota bacterium]|nr:acyl-CoA desaturase [Acidobacteriota bacterium]